MIKELEKFPEMANEVATPSEVIPITEVPIKKSTFDLMVEALLDGPKSRKALAEILFNNSRKEGYSRENAFAQVPIRLNHLRRRGFVITSRDKRYHLDGKISSGFGD